MEEISSFCKKVEVSKARCDCVVNYSKGQINTQGDPATGIVRAQPRRHDSEVENRLEGARIWLVIPVIEKDGVASLEIAGWTS